LKGEAVTRGPKEGELNFIKGRRKKGEGILEGAKRARVRTAGREEFTWYGFS